MIEQDAAPSLQRRLSIRLAAQSVVVSILVAALVYGMAAAHLVSRQADELSSKRDLVLHLLGEAAADMDVDRLRHHLDDYFGSHVDFALELIGADAGFTYLSRNKVPANRAKVIEFEIAGAATSVAARGRLILDLTADRRLLAHLAWILGGSALVGAVIVTIAVGHHVRRGLAPVGELVARTRALSAANLSQRLDEASQPRELRPLVEQFNALLTRLDEAYGRLDGFSANVAHELNTPLTTLITSTELALRKPQEAPALRDTLGDHLEDLRRLSRIVRDMLFLARAENGSRAGATSVPSLAAIAGQVVEYHEAMLEEAGLAATIDGDASACMDVPLLQRALSNLLSNATRFAARDSTVRVELRGGDKEVSICVANRGPAIAAEDLPRIFDRFFRADRARVQADVHHGLGLSIVAAIARMHGGQPWASSASDWTRVGLRIPAVRAEASDRLPGAPAPRGAFGSGTQ